VVAIGERHTETALRTEMDDETVGLEIVVVVEQPEVGTPSASGTGRDVVDIAVTTAAAVAADIATSAAAVDIATSAAADNYSCSECEEIKQGNR
jgi:hypothetical protein